MTKRKYYNQEKTSKEYSGRIAEEFTKREIDIINSYLPNKKLKILDIPCGYGRFLDAFKGHEVIGADFSQGMLNIASENHDNLVRCDAFNTPFKDGEFDVVMSMHFVYHYKNLEDILREFKRISKGVIIFDTNNYSLKSLPFFGDRKVYIHKREHVESVLRDLGFRRWGTTSAFSLSQRAYGGVPDDLLNDLLDICGKFIPLKTFWCIYCWKDI